MLSSYLLSEHYGKLTPSYYRRSHKEIAVSTGQRFDTTHTYIEALYARFDVSSRAAFMALWLKGS